MLILSFLLASSCGIKAPPKPPLPPPVDIKRIGDYVYVFPKEKNTQLKVKGFNKLDDFYYKVENKAFCFDVYDKTDDISGSFCVPKAIDKKPKILKVERNSDIKIYLSGFDTYKIYITSSENSILYPKSFKRVNRNIFKTNNIYNKSFCFAITGDLNGFESKPNFVCFKKEAPPKPSPPKGVSFNIYNGKLYIYWDVSKDPNVIGYLIEENSKLITKKPVEGNVFVTKAPRVFTRYSIIAVNRFGEKSEPYTVNITLNLLRKAAGERY